MSTKLLFLLLAWMSVPQCSYTQEQGIIAYYNTASKARYCYHTGQYRKAAGLLRCAFALPGARHHLLDYYCMALCHLQQKDTAVALDWLEKCVCYDGQVSILLFEVVDSTAAGFQGKYNRFKIPGFEFLHREQRFKARFQSIIDSCAHVRDRQAAFSRMLHDSSYYYWVNNEWHFLPSFRDNIRRAPVFSHWLDSNAFADLEHLEQRMVQFLKTYGYPGLLNSGSEMLFTAVSHLSTDRKKEVQPILFKALEEGNLSPCQYGFFLERWEMDTAGGTWCGRYNVIHTACPSDKWPGIVKNRQALGMSIYLDGDDYTAQAFNLPRKPFPWVRNAKMFQR